jgi:hypothetical protein
VRINYASRTVLAKVDELVDSYLDERGEAAA